jgi:dopamine beta-monooxygenase
MIFATYSMLFVLLFSSFRNGVTTRLIEESKPKITKPLIFQQPLDGHNKHRIFWSLDYKTKTATIEVRANLNRTRDWFAIGFSDYGNITLANLCVLWFDLSGKSHLDDTTTDADSFIGVQEQNDCIFLKLNQQGNTIRLVFQRKFRTCDPKDYIIEDGTTHVVYATGRGPLKHLSNIQVSDYEHGFIRTRFLKPDSKPTRHLPEGTMGIKFLNNHTRVPSDETTYWCSLHSFPKELQDVKHHVIQYQAVIQNGSESLVHHMELFHCEVGVSVDLPPYEGPCLSSSRPKELDPCKRVIAAWAMGAEPLVYPPEAGLPIGGKNFSRFVMLEIHYNNPELRSDFIDSSGIQFYYTKDLRKYDIGVIEIGLEYTDKNSIPPKQAAFDLSGYCVSECTRIGLPESGITVFASQLHTHLTGVRVWTKHIRGGRELPELNRDNHYSQHFQEIRILTKPVKVFPGDALINTCRYDTRGRTNMTLGGFAIRNEMCVNYMHYYPKTDLEVCKSSIDSRILEQYFEYMREFEGEETSRGAGYSHNFNAIHWGNKKAADLMRLYENSPLSMQCNRSSGERFVGDWEGTPITRIYSPLHVDKDGC